RCGRPRSGGGATPRTAARRGAPLHGRGIARSRPAVAAGRASRARRSRSEDLLPASRLHELTPAGVEATLIVLAGIGERDVGDRARQREAVVLERARRPAEPHLVVVGMLPRDGAAARRRGVSPVTQVALAGCPR